MEKGKKRCPQSAGHQIYDVINRKTKVGDIEELLREGKSPDRSPAGCPSPLHRAVRFNRPDIALALLNAGCQVTASRRVEQLHSPIVTIAASLDMTEVVLKLCSKAERNLFTVGDQLQTIVHIAVARRNHELLKGLSSYCRNSFSRFLGLRDGLGLTPLHLAASIGDVTTLKLLVQGDECCEPELSEHRELHSDLTERSPSVQDFHGSFHLNSKLKTSCENTLFCKNVVTGEKAPEQFARSVRQKPGGKLMDHRVLGSKETMLHLAARGHHTEAVQFLLSCSASVNVQDMMNNTPLHLLISHGNANHRAVAAARLLLTAGADWTLKGTFQQRYDKSPHRCATAAKPHSHSHREVTVGMIAALRNRVAYLKLLAEFGARFEEVDATNMTTLMHALSHGSEEAARYLLINHPEQTIFHTWRDGLGNTALHLVSHCHSKAGELTRLMLDRGYGAALWSGSNTSPSRSSPRVTDPPWSSGHPTSTPVTRSILNQRLDVLQELIRHDPGCLLEDSPGITHSPLHVAVREIPDERCVPFVDVLLAHGCDGNAVVCGLTAYEYALTGEGRRQEGVPAFSASYLKRKLGVFFRQAGSSGGERSGQEQWPVSLRDLCMDRVRRLARAARGRYYEDISSLPLPPSVIRGLLFQT